MPLPIVGGISMEVLEIVLRICQVTLIPLLAVIWLAIDRRIKRIEDALKGLVTKEFCIMKHDATTAVVKDKLDYLFRNGELDRIKSDIKDLQNRLTILETKASGAEKD
jgi:hypothetical protein